LSIVPCGSVKQLVPITTKTGKTLQLRFASAAPEYEMGLAKPLTSIKNHTEASFRLVRGVDKDSSAT
jgi:hypothetical protein